MPNSGTWISIFRGSRVDSSLIYGMRAPLLLLACPKMAQGHAIFACRSAVMHLYLTVAFTSLYMREWPS
jgi:hypothetical protein